MFPRASPRDIYRSKMTSSRLPPRDLADLLPWFERAARRVARDPDVAEDLAQEACLAALRNPPAMDRPAAPWFIAVMRRML